MFLFYFKISHMKFFSSLWNVWREELADEYVAGQEIDMKTHASTNKSIYISVAMVYKSKLLVIH